MPTALEVYEQHVAAIASGDLDAIVAGYARDAVVVHPDGAGRGHEYVRELFGAALPAMGDLRPEVEVHDHDEVVLAVWRSSTDPDRPRSGADTFVIRNGLITHHTGTGL